MQLKKSGYSDLVAGKFSCKFSVTIFFREKMEISLENHTSAHCNWKNETHAFAGNFSCSLNWKKSGFSCKRWSFNKPSTLQESFPAVLQYLYFIYKKSCNQGMNFTIKHEKSSVRVTNPSMLTKLLQQLSNSLLFLIY